MNLSSRRIPNLFLTVLGGPRTLQQLNTEELTTSLMKAGPLGVRSAVRAVRAIIGVVGFTTFAAETIHAQQFCNPSEINLPGKGAADLYPSNIAVSGLSDVVGDVTVTLNNIQHTYSSDLEVLLVSPAGEKFVVFSQVGGSRGFSTAATVTLSDAAAGVMPGTSSVIVSGTYKPTKHGSVSFQRFPEPAPPPPYNNPQPTGTETFASVFAGTTPNGVWSLYIHDRNGRGRGSISGGWCLNITTVPRNAGRLEFSSGNQLVAESEGSAILSVERAGDSLGAVTVDYATVAGGTATGGTSCGPGVDFIETSGTLSFADGEKGEKSFAVQLCYDSEDEPNETVKLQLSNPQGGAVLGSPDAVNITIRNSAPGRVRFSPDFYSASDFQPQTAAISVERRAAVDGASFTVDYATGGGTAIGGASCTEGVDYISTSGTLEFPRDEVFPAIARISVTVCQDSVVEPDEYLAVTLSNPSPGTTIDGTETATVTIVENQPAIYTVNADDDSTDGLCNAAHCSLREALISANGAPSADEIRFDPAFFNQPRVILQTHSTSFLGTTTMEIRESVTVRGPGANLLQITGVSRHFNTSGNVTLSGLRVDEFEGGIDNYGTLNLIDVVVENIQTDPNGVFGYLGTIQNRRGTLTLTNSLITANTSTSSSGGAVYNVEGGTVNVINSTISGNTSVGFGGGIYNSDGTVNVSHSTIAGNVSADSSAASGGGIYHRSGTVNIRNSIIAGNTKESGAKQDLAGAFTSQGYNLIETTTDAIISGDTGTDMTGQDPSLGPLQNNGGPTRTHAPLPGSLAIDRGNSFGLTTDQRGAIRPVDLDDYLNAGDGADIGAVELQKRAEPRLLNISTRLRVLTGDRALIGGFIITGLEPKKVIIRAIGPSLTGQGVQGALPDTTLELFGSNGQSLAFNDNWRESQESEIQGSTIPPDHDLESAIVRNLDPGFYTAVVRGKNNATGIGLVEVYDLAQGADARLANISSRGFVNAGDNVMIGGFIAATGRDTRVVVRALGPSLGAAGVPDPLQNPTLQLVDGNGAVIRGNDDWKSDQQSEIEATGVPPGDDRESALVATLSPGNYTAIVRGSGDTVGVGVVEVYDVP